MTVTKLELRIASAKHFAYLAFSVNISEVKQRAGPPLPMRETGRMNLSLLVGTALAIAPGQTDQAKLGSPSAAEVVVTARRRQEEAHDVPISITVHTGENLERSGAVNLEDIARLSPNLALAPSGLLGATHPSIRGLYSAVGAPTVGLYLDDTPFHIRPLLGFVGSADPIIFDLRRVEVLRGPQGTLFGAGSLGGTVRYITAQPQLTGSTIETWTEISTLASGGLGYAASTVAGFPLIEDKLGIRGGIHIRRQPGFVDRLDSTTGEVEAENVNHMDTIVLKAAAKGMLSDGATATASILYQDARSADLPLFESSRGLFKQAFQQKQPGRDRFFLPSLLVEFELGDLWLTSVTSIFDRREKRTSDYSSVFGELVLGGAVPGLSPAGGTRNLTGARQRNINQELRLSSGTHVTPLSWTSGIYYNRGRVNFEQEVSEPGVTDLVRSFLGGSIEDVFGAPLLPGGVTYRGTEEVVEQELALFGELTWRFMPGLELSAGMRVSRSTLDLKVFSEGPYAGPASSSNKTTAQTSETPVTPRLVLSYRPADNTLVYTSVSRGYRAGGANTPVPKIPCGSDLELLGRTTAPVAYGSDAVWSYELGAKSDGLAKNLQVSGAVFHIDWSEVQQQVFLPRCGFSYVDNLGQARSRGFELDLAWRPVSGLHVSSRLGYSDARFSKSIFGGAAPDSVDRALIVSRGDRILNTPAWSASAAAEYRFSLSTGAEAKRSPEIDERYLRNHILPKFGRLRLDEVAQSDLVAWLASKHKIDGYAAATVNRLQVILSYMFKLAHRWGIPGAENNPLKGVSLLKPNNEKERFLSPEETRRLQKAVEASENPQLKYIVALLLLTGARKSELLKAKWEEFDLPNRRWRLPTSKSGRARHMPLPVAAVEVLTQLQRWRDCPYVLPNPRTLQPFTAFFNSWDTARRRAGLPDVRIHDLRHSAASNLVNSGQSLYVVSKVLGHANTATSQRYAHLSQQTLLAAVDAAADKMGTNWTEGSNSSKLVKG